MNKYVVELIGTFFFVLVIGCVVVGNAVGALTPLAIGSALMVMIYAGGHISGGHYNPAVTVGVWIRGSCEAKDVLPYMVAQLVGAGLAAGVTRFLVGAPKGSALAPAIGPAFVAEFLFTLALVFVVLNTATVKSKAGNSFYGLAIGSTVMVGAFAVGSISGGAFNPAVAFGATIIGLIAPSSVWIHVVADFLGAAGAGVIFRLVNPNE